MKVSLVIPVYNESEQLALSISKLCGQFTGCSSFSLEIIIADNGSTDGTGLIADQLSRDFPNVKHLHLAEKGRGLALKHAWLSSDADVLAYMDVDLSSDISSFPELLKPLFNNTADLCVGSRLLIPEWTRRGWKRELLSRGYNWLLKVVFHHSFSDAQCGFKAISRAAAQELLPLVENPSWFFDTELLLIAEHHGYRIQDLPVHWRDDPDSRVSILETITEDLRGIIRLKRRGILRPTNAAVSISESGAVERRRLAAVAIATYAPPNFGPMDEGVGNSNRQKYLALADYYGKDSRVIVLANRNNGSRFPYTEGNLHIIPCWRRGSVVQIFQMLRALFRSTSALTLFIEVEIRMFKSWCTLAMLPLILAFARLRGLRVITTLHQVVLVPEVIGKQFRMSSDAVILPRVLYCLLWLYYMLLTISSDALVVHEPEFAREGFLARRRKWRIIPHGVQPDPPTVSIDLGLPKDQLVLLCFGSLVWYKGLPRLLEHYEQLLSDWDGSMPAPHLVLAGAPSPHELGNSSYLREVNDYLERARSLGVQVTGFVPPEHVSAYFYAADICLFPYTSFFATSGPFALALGHGRPFLLSRELAPLLRAEDVRACLEDYGFSEADFIFDDAQTLRCLVQLTTAERERREQLSRGIGQKRQWQSVVSRLVSIVNE